MQIQRMVWLGGVPSRTRWHALKSRGVAFALSLLGEFEPPPWIWDASDLLWLQVLDGHAPSIAQLKQSADFIDHAIAARAGILVFCGAGMGRAPTAYAAWRMRVTRSSEDVVMGEIRSLRSIVHVTQEQYLRLKHWRTILD